MNSELKNQLYKPIMITVAQIIFLCSILSAFNIENYYGVVSFASCIINIPMFLVFYSSEGYKRKKYIIIAICITLIPAFVFYALLLRSLQGLLNECGIGLSYTEAIDSHIFLIYISFLLSVLENIFCTKNIRASLVAVPLVSNLVLIIAGYIPDTIYLVMTLALVVSFFAMPSEKSPNSNQSVMAAVTGTLLLCFWVLWVMFPKELHEKPAFFENIRKQIIEMFDKPDQNIVETSVASGGVNGGKLGQFDSVEYSGKVMLTLTTGFKGKVYLKGFVGAFYEDNAWRDYTEQEYGDYLQMFESAQENGVYFSKQSAQLLSIIDYDDNLKSQISAETDKYLSTVVRRNYSIRYEEAPVTLCYAPYNSMYFMSQKSSPDGFYAGNDKGVIDSLQYCVNGIDYSEFKKLTDGYYGDNGSFLEYIRYEKEYRKFVYDRYTRIGDDERQLVASIKDEIPDCQDREEFIGELKKYFENNYTYTLSPGKLEEGDDFVEWFVNNKKGYCTYFATAAAVILRSRNIPARYVEGYCKIIDEENAEQTRQQSLKVYCGNMCGIDTYNEYVVALTDECAHAWVEVYIDGYGWIPYEFTPRDGYADVVDTENYEENIKYDEIKEPEYVENQMNQDTENDVTQQKPSESQENKTLIFLTDYFQQVLYVWVKRFVYFLVGLAVVVAGIVIPERIVAIRNRKILVFNPLQTALQTNKQIIRMYKYFEKMCRFFKIKRDEGMSYTDFAKLAMKRRICFDEADVMPLIRCAQKVSFGKGNIDNQEMGKAISCLKAARDGAVKELRLPELLLFRYIWHL